MGDGSFQITFIMPDGSRRVVHAAAGEDALSGHGRPGSLLDIALSQGIEIEHACGGVCACGTCHVIVRRGADSCSPPAEEEEDCLDEAYGVTPQSRLACQCVPDGTEDLEVEVPAWNRNLARERGG